MYKEGSDFNETWPSTYDDIIIIIIIITITQYNNARAPVHVYNIHIVLLCIRVSVRDRILRRPLCSPIVIKRNFRRVIFVGDERPQESL